MYVSLFLCIIYAYLYVNLHIFPIMRPKIFSKFYSILSGAMNLILKIRADCTVQSALFITLHQAVPSWKLRLSAVQMMCTHLTAQYLYI